MTTLLMTNIEAGRFENDTSPPSPSSKGHKIRLKLPIWSFSKWLSRPADHPCLGPTLPTITDVGDQLSGAKGGSSKKASGDYFYREEREFHDTIGRLPLVDKQLLELRDTMRACLVSQPNRYNAKILHCTADLDTSPSDA